MEIKLLMVAGTVVLSLLPWLNPLWRARRYAAVIGTGLQLTAVTLFVWIEPSIWSAAFASITAYLIINYARLVRNRMQETYQRRVTFRTAGVLSGLQVVLVLAAWLDTAPDLTIGTLIYIIAGFQLLVGLVLLSSTSRHLRTTRTLQATKAYTDQQLPTVSVLIPARNETEDLDTCLAALTASNYPKLEIIVLDDCSQNKRTPEIIREYAQAGVQFIAGQAPGDNWLAKNYAYQQLADAANGDYLLFCGVDLRMDPGAIRELITTLLEKQKVMLSILPKNVKPNSFGSLLVQPMRYAWEISLPRRLFNRPPILSTCWIVKRSFLESHGSFKATSRSITPEGHFARAAARQDGYSFLRSDMLLSNKPVREQLATAVRMRYPQLHRQIEFVWGLSIVEFIALVLPLPLTAVFIASGHMPAALISLVAYGMNCAVFMQVSGVMYGKPVASGLILTPFVALYDILLLNYSMYRYEFREVRWKERNICLPIMRFDQLPPRAKR